jgi:hypothetical protein
MPAILRIASFLLGGFRIDMDLERMPRREGHAKAAEPWQSRDEASRGAQSARNIR